MPGGAALTRPTLPFALEKISSSVLLPNNPEHDELSLITLWQGDVNFIKGDS